MTDERLLARLRGRGIKDTIAAADRIEALTKERDEAMQLLQTLSNMNGDLSRDMYKTKLQLAKLVSIEKRVTSFEDTTEELAECGCARCKAHLDLRALLAEIEGEKT
jgi:hypothetical protein